MSWAWPLIGLLSLVALWQAVITGFQVRPFIAPDPLTVVHALWDNRQLLWSNIQPTAVEAIAGFFVGNGIGFLLALEKPLGIGPLVFGQIYGEDTHNIWLKMLMDYGWLGFVSYVTLTLWTVAAGFRLLLRDRPWQPYVLCADVVYLGHIGLGDDGLIPFGEIGFAGDVERMLDHGRASKCVAGPPQASRCSTL